MTTLLKPLVPVFMCAILAFGCKIQIPEPAPYGALPTVPQQNWHRMETYAFLHFTTNTFTGKEWGYGDEEEAVFNPTDFDADQIIGTLASAGFQGAILTTKHHDGFCLWPSKYTEHSVKNSPWKNGQGDVVKEISEACKKYGIKFGVYLSPWDRNHAGYGTEEYIEYYRKQLRELLTGYGDIFEVWLDGANGGDGYYGGARETRQIDRSVYYQWEETLKIIHELQPNAIVFSDSGPDSRWVGNEEGYAKDSCWATYTPEARDGETKANPGTTKYWIGETGTLNGKYWMPAEVDVSIRPGWFYHRQEDEKVKSLERLTDIYFKSVGNGTTLNLNVPPDRTGKINPIDSLRLMEFRAYLDQAFSRDLLQGSKVKASSVRGRNFSPDLLVDNDPATYWATGDGETTGSIEFDLMRPETINCILLQENISLGQRVCGFTVDKWENGEWKEIAKASTIGYKKLLKFENCSTNKLRITINSALACPAISTIAAYGRHPNQNI
ncbi:MAG: alpha-L-fucosidase [Mangrovibacterium sp.]